MTRRSVQVRAGTALIDRELVVPGDAPGLVVYAHGSGGSRFSIRKPGVARTHEEDR